MPRLTQTETAKVISSYSILTLSILICLSFAVAGTSYVYSQQQEVLTSPANDTDKEQTTSDRAITFKDPFYETTTVEVLSKRIIRCGQRW